MKYFILFFFISNFIIAQNYSVSSYQKINELNASFLGDLDDEDFFAISIDQIGDLDGNGVIDLAVGAYADDDGGYNRGAVWILFLDVNDQVISHTKISDISGGFTGILDDDDRFGGAVSYLGDLNSDGLIELAVGADYDEDGGYWHGAVWILSLNPDGSVSSHAKISDTQGGFTGVLSGEAIFGTDITNIGDLNGDGIQDLAVGSRRIDTAGPRRGSVWILFLNSDFTVNSHQQISDTQGNFSGILEYEDYFGGSVANLGDLNGDGVVDLVVGAYRDDDQNLNSGSFYVLFLNTDGTVNFHQKVSNLEGGLSSQVSQDALFGESIDGIVDIDSDGKIEIIVGAMKHNNPTLSVSTGGFYIIELNPDGTVSEEFFYSYAENCFSGNLENGDLFGGSVCFLNDDINNLKVAIGAYSDSENGFRKGAAWILNLGEVSFNLDSSMNPTGCGTQDGSITISGLNPNTAYTLDYNYEGSLENLSLVSDGSGTITVSNLDAGIYSAIVITEDATSCTDDLADVELIASVLMATITFTDPTGCGTQDGSITISGLNPNTAYTLDYNYEGSLENLSLVSDGSGTITVSNLDTGIYSTIVITEDATSCTDDLTDVELIASALMATITFTDPTGCGTQDGSIVISGLNPNTAYTLDYNYEGSLENLSLVSDGSGTITVSNLDAGIYSAIVITEDATSCTDDLADVELIASVLMATITFTDPTGCGTQDGSITISGLNPNTAYTLDYNYEGSLENLSLVSDGSGTITVSNLDTGIYSTIVITEDATSCTDDLTDVELIASALMATITFTDPTGCGTQDGSITISGLNPNTAYTLDYNYEGSLENLSLVSDVSGTITVSNLDTGIYSTIVITEDATSCTDDLTDVELIASALMATITFTDPTGCGTQDGSIVISGLNPNTAYTLDYNYEGSLENLSLVSDGSGTITVSNLDTGIYSTIVITEDATSCTDDLTDVELIASALMATITFTDPTGCGTQDGSIVISGLNPNTAYTLDYNYEGSLENLSLVSDGSGTITVSNLDAGIYSAIVITEDATSCTDDLADVELIASVLMATITFTDPTGCGTQDGSITISGLNPNTAYTLDYNYEGSLENLSLVSDGSGTITVSNLDTGIYSTIVITEDATSCTDDLTDVELIASALMATITFTDPTGCGTQDGSITISGLNPNTAYTLDYNYEGSLENLSLVSDVSGTITVSNLDTGIYSAIVITEDATSCTDDLADVELIASALMATITFTDPTGCGTQDGSITISGLNPNTAYTLDYNYEGNLENLSLVSDGSGTITVSNLDAGIYSAIVITEDATSCTDDLADVELIASVLMATITFTDPTGCGTQDGSITISGLNPNTAYTLDYNYEGSLENLSLVSDGSGTITVSNLDTGIYSTIVITEDATSCTDDLTDVELIASALMATITFTDPTGCGTQDGSITISGLNPNTAYTLDYNYEGSLENLSLVSDVSGTITVSNLDTGIYSAIVITEDATSCTDDLADVELIASVLMATITFTDPTGCGTQDGSITISGLNPNTAYTLDYNYEGNLENLSLVSDGSGTITVSNLDTGIYSAIVITEDATSCTDDLTIIELECEDSFDCFKTRKFFTPNGDGYKDYWFLEQQSFECIYVLYIYDRYGKLLKTLTPNNSKWDGTYNGVKMPSSDYWYLVKYTNFEGKRLEYRSHFTLKR